MYIGPKSRTERPRKTKIGTEVAHITRDSDTTFKVKGQLCSGQGHIVAASLTAYLVFYCHVLNTFTAKPFLHPALKLCSMHDCEERIFTSVMSDAYER